jgi:hypothetical protein
MTETPTAQRAICATSAFRLHSDGADIGNSYSADRIASAEPVRKPFRHDGALWVCTSITGSGLSGSGRAEHEAYRLVPERLFAGPPTTYAAKTGTGEAAEAARNDPSGFYHGIAVKHGPETFVLCGPPVRFVAEEIAAGAEPALKSEKPLQLSLF